MKTTTLRPVLTEKSLTMASRGWFTFAVDMSFSKGRITQVIEKAYKVTVTDIRSTTVVGKTRRAGRTSRLITKSNWKKAYVRLAKGQTIDAFEISPEATGATA